ncbi:Hypothetical protein SCF082_LOCUS17764 [Durusdinium trenchii]|uniref:Uncharacterized protein n=1 Tax=Durusdinium trenchii TaxID=1381693 RepID=A0ABP0KKA0_9DINO
MFAAGRRRLLRYDLAIRAWFVLPERNVTAGSADIVIKQKNASAARRVRMHELQRGMIDHDEARAVHGPNSQQKKILITDLLLRGEELIEAEALEDQCMPIAWRFLAATYDATPQEVLMMLRQVKSFTTKNHGFTTASRKELEQIADEILHSLATRLEDAPAYFLKEVLETMKQCEVGSTVLD